MGLRHVVAVLGILLFLAACGSGDDAVELQADTDVAEGDELVEEADVGSAPEVVVTEEEGARPPVCDHVDYTFMVCPTVAPSGTEGLLNTAAWARPTFVEFPDFNSDPEGRVVVDIALRQEDRSYSDFDIEVFFSGACTDQFGFQLVEVRGDPQGRACTFNARELPDVDPEQAFDSAVSTFVVWIEEGVPQFASFRASYAPGESGARTTERVGIPDVEDAVSIVEAVELLNVWQAT